MGWDEATDELAGESDLLSQSVSEADELRTSSDTEPSSQRGLKAVWWAQRLSTLTKVKRPKRPLAGLSACSGCCAEAYVLTVS